MTKFFDRKPTPVPDVSTMTDGEFADTPSRFPRDATYIASLDAILPHIDKDYTDKIRGVVTGPALAERIATSSIDLGDDKKSIEVVEEATVALQAATDTIQARLDNPNRS